MLTGSSSTVDRYIDLLGILGLSDDRGYAGGTQKLQVTFDVEGDVLTTRRCGAIVEKSCRGSAVDDALTETRHLSSSRLSVGDPDELLGSVRANSSER